MQRNLGYSQCKEHYRRVPVASCFDQCHRQCRIERAVEEGRAKSMVRIGTRADVSAAALMVTYKDQESSIDGRLVPSLYRRSQ